MPGWDLERASWKPDPRKRSGGKRRPMSARTPIAIDGEGVSDDEHHRYTMLVSSEGEPLLGESLTPKQCFDWLLALPPRRLIVIYGGNYDVTMWLRGLPTTKLLSIHAEGTPYTYVTLEGERYRISYKPRRWFDIGKRVGCKWESRRVYDQFGYYQHSFVKALEEWQVGTPAVRARIAMMKERRADFAHLTQREILAYSLEECQLLVQLTEKLLAAVAAVGLKPTSYHGPGALATALLGREGVREYLPDKTPEEMERKLYSAYYGGRFEIARAGWVGDAYSYDINSAYPYECSRLPCLKHATWRKVNRYQPSLYGVWRVCWLLPDGALWGPFPYRTPTGSIIYPAWGQGWYWSPEVAAAMDVWHDCIEVLEGWVLDIGCTHRPFAFVPELYEYRKRLKAAGALGEQLTLKLMLNSLYGKTAQTIGHGRRPPPFMSFVWAGLITSGTRAKLYRAMAQDFGAVVSVATDGILTTRQLELEKGKALGSWEYTPVSDLWVFQSGVFCYVKDGGEYVTRTRGFSPRELTHWELALAFAFDPLGTHRYEVRRFVGLGMGLQLKDCRNQIGQWRLFERRFEFAPSAGYRQCWGWENKRKDTSVVHHIGTLSSNEEGVDSYPYTPKNRWAEMWGETHYGEEYMIEMEQP